MSSLLSAADPLHQAACQARDRFWARYGSPQRPCQALGLQPVKATYALHAQVAADADRDQLPISFEGFSVCANVGGALHQER